MALKGAANKMVRSSNYIGNISRTAFPRLYDFRNTFSAGYLFPIYADEVYPGSNKKIDVGALVRSITPLGPVMDKSFLDIFFFFVPSRLVWDHFEEFIAGYNKEAWTQGIEYKKPKIIFKPGYTSVTNNAFLHSFLDYLPGACDVVDVAEVYQSAAAAYDAGDYSDDMFKPFNDSYWIDALYPRSYVKIWNDWFRDENLQDELELYTGDSDEYADEFAFNLLSADDLPKAAKYHNRFTSALPAPVKGPDVLIPMTGLQISNNLPVGINLENALTTTGNAVPGYANGSELAKGFNQASIYSSSQGIPAGTGLFANTSGAVANNVNNTIRMLRVAVQTEKLLARDARGGTRFCESILSHFGVHNGDARLQRSEYLGSVQIPLQVQQVTNTTQAEGSALGNVGGQSVTRFNNHVVNAAFSEWGIVLGLAVVRTNISYSSGVRKIYQREARFDHIWPEFKHIGDIPLKRRELYSDGVSSFEDGVVDDVVFGYTPYASEKREGYNFNTGLFRARASGNLSYLTYQEKYGAGELPVLSEDWIKQPTDIVTDTLVDQSGPQYYALWEISEVAVEPLDPTSDPGLMDHF